jgi:hydrogenase maturation protease
LTEAGEVKALVLGLGNILLSDEGVGVRVVERLQAEHRLPPVVEVLDGGTAGMDLLDAIAGVDALIVADAVRVDAPPGTVLRLEDQEVHAYFGARLTPHQLGLCDLLATLRLTNESPRRIVVVGIAPENLELGLELSATAEQACDRAVREIVDELSALGLYEPAARHIACAE